MMNIIHARKPNPPLRRQLIPFRHYHTSQALEEKSDMIWSLAYHFQPNKMCLKNDWCADKDGSFHLMQRKKMMFEKPVDLMLGKCMKVNQKYPKDCFFLKGNIYCFQKSLRNSGSPLCIIWSRSWWKIRNFQEKKGQTAKIQMCRFVEHHQDHRGMLMPNAK